MLSPLPVLLFVLGFLEAVHSGLIYPDTFRPIDPFRNNVPVNVGSPVDSDYTFNFRVQTPMSNNPIIHITFPAIYSFPLAATYTCTFIQSPTVITELCKVASDQRTLIFPKDAAGVTAFTQITGSSASLIVSSLTNPVVAGDTGSGFFAMSTISQEGLTIDSNDFFGSIGLATSYTNFASVGIQNDGASIAGFVTNYVIDFTNTVSIPKGSWFRLLFPTGYTFTSNLDCQFVNPAQTVTCSAYNQYLLIGGINQDLAPGSWRFKTRNIQNPFQQASFTGFMLEALIEGTNTVIQTSSAFAPVSITAGTISSVSISAVPLNKNLRIDYDITFSTTNTIPAAGGIRIDFPATFGSLDSTCRIIRGLTASGSAITCTASSVTKQISITGITETSPQFIEIKIYATNPNTIGPTPQFAIHTYSSTPFGTTNLIDENLNSGQVVISDVDNPILTVVDMYTAIVNITLGGIGPNDFRIYPNTAMAQSTTVAPLVKPSIWIQIPLWWDGVSINGRYQCNFALVDSGDTNGCTYSNNVFKMTTPTTQGFGTCDLPISINRVRVTPIPGSWPFRVLLFADWTTLQEPFEQDLYYVDLPATQFNPAPTAVTTSLDSNDADAVLIFSFNIGSQVPATGAINLNFSTVASIYENTASWDPTLGFTFGANTFIPISCRIQIAGNVVGYPTAGSHPNANCILYKGSTTKSALIQVIGFGNTLAAGTAIVLHFPNIKFCSEVTMNCQVMLTTAYTTVTTEPYSLNYYLITFGAVKSYPTISTTTVAATTPTFGTNTMICRNADWTFTFSPVTTLTGTAAANSWILLKFPANKFTFPRTNRAVSVATGNAVLIYVLEYDEIYYLFQLTTTLSSPGPVSFIIQNLINSNGEINTAKGITDLSGVEVKQIYWTNWDIVEKLKYPVSSSWTDGGIWGTSMAFYPNPTPFVRNFNLDDWIPYTITFTICHEVNSTGAFEIKVPIADFQEAAPTCSVWGGLTGITYNKGLTTQLTCTWHAGTSAYRVQGFYQVPQFSTITVGFSLKSKLTPLTTANTYTINTYFDQTYAVGQINDYLPTPQAGMTNPGAKIAPDIFEFANYTSQAKPARMGTLGTFTFYINLNTPLPNYNSAPANDYRIEFILPGSMTLPAGLECRINGDVSYHCYGTGGLTIVMNTNQYNGIPANTRIPVVITTLGANTMDNWIDGIAFGASGRFTITATSYIGSTAQESAQLEIEVYGQAFRTYWVYSINKGKGGLTTFQVKAIPPPGTTFDASDAVAPALQGLIVLEFLRSPTSGFATDLGTGIANNQPIPCISIGLNIIAGQTDVTCTLVYGKFNNPVKINVWGFAQTTFVAGAGFEIHIPNVYNPDYSLDVPNIRTRVYQIDTTTGVKTETWEGDYPLINNTFTQTPATTTFAVATAPTLGTTALNTATTLTVQVRPTVALQASDHVVVELPLFWKPPKTLTCTVGGATLACVGYPDAKWVLIEITAGSIGTGGANVVINLNSPPALIPTTATIKAHYYHIFKHWSTATYPAMTPTLVPYTFTSTAISSSVMQVSLPSIYTFTFVPNQNIPLGGAIQIKIPSVYSVSATTCTNNAIGGSLLSDVGFKCSIDTTNKIITAWGFPAFTANQQVVLQALLTNPATTTNPAFVYSTAYLYDVDPLNILTTICLSNVPSPVLTTTVTPNPTVWNIQYSGQKLLYTTDVGPFEFKFAVPTAIAPAEFLIIDFPAAFTIAPQGQPDCFWDGVPGVCTWTVATSRLRISPPTGTTITATTTHSLKITTLNGMNGVNGWTMPTAGLYSFTFWTTPDGSTQRELKVYKIEVYGVPFTYFASTTEITNYNMKTSIKIDFNPATTIASTGYLIVSFPTLSIDETVTLWDNDMRSGVASGGSLPCHDFGSTFGLSPTCIITHGNQLSGTPVQIKVSGFGTLSAGTLYSFRITGITTPAVSGDNKHVWVKLDSYTSGAVLINSGLFYDFTIQKVDPTVVDYTANAAYLPTTSPLNPGQSGVVFNMIFRSTVALTAAEMFDYFILEFPSTLPQPLGLKCNTATDTECVSLPGNNWVFYNKTSNTNANTDVPTVIRNAVQAVGQIPPAVLVSYAVVNRMVRTKIIYPPILYTSLVPQSVPTTVNIPTYQTAYVPKNAPVKFQIGFTVPNSGVPVTVPSTGAVEIVVPSTGFTVTDQFCTNDDTSLITGYISCTYVPATTSYVITGFDTLASGSTGLINVWGSVTSATAPSFSVRLWNDAAMTTKIGETTTAVASAAISTYTGFQKLYPLDYLPLSPFGVKTNDIAPYRFTVTFSTAAVAKITVTFGSGVSIPTSGSLLCGWGTAEAAYCTATATSPLTIDIYAPNSPALTATTYNVFITSMYGSEKGLQFATAGKFTATVAIGASNYYLPYEVYSADFTSGVVSSLWGNVNVANGLIVTLTPSSGITTGGKVVVSFPRYTLDGLVSLFSPDLGTGLATGSAIPCWSDKSGMLPLSTLSEVTCTLKYGTDAYTYVEVTDFQTISAGTSFTFFIRSFVNPNPTTAETGHVHVEVHTEYPVGTVLNKRLFADVINTQSPTYPTVGVTPGAVSYTRTSNNVQATGEIYAFGAITLNTGLKITTRSSIVIEFPTTYSPTISGAVSGVTCKVGGVTQATIATVYGNYIVIKPDSADFATGPVTISVLGMTNAVAADNTAIYIYINYYNVYQTKITATSTAYTALAITTGSALTSTSTTPGLETDFVFDLVMPAGIPQGGTLKIVCPQFTQVSQGFLSYTSSKVPISFYSGISGSDYVAVFTFGVAYVPSDGNVQVKLRGIPSATAQTVNFAVATYHNKWATNMIAQIANIAYTTTAGLPIAATSNMITSSLDTSLVSSVTIYYTPNAGITAANIDTFEISGLTGFTTPLLCRVNGVLAGSCSISSGVLTMGTVTMASTLNTITFTIINPATAGVYRLFFKTYNSGATTYLDVGTEVVTIIATAFTSFTASFNHNTPGYPGILSIGVRPPAAVSSGYLILELQGFDTNLGTYANSSTIPCYCSSAASLVCTIEGGVGIKPPRVFISNFGTLPSGSVTTIKLLRVTTPTITTRSVAIYGKISTITIGNKEVDVYGGAQILTFVTATVTAATSTMTVSATTIQTAATYTFDIIPAFDEVYFHLQLTDYTNAGTPGAGTLYKPGGVLHYTTARSAGYTLSVSSLNNPWGIPTTSTITAYCVDAGALVYVITYTPSTFTGGAITSPITWTSLQANNVAAATDYLVSFTLLNPIPAGGIIRFQMATSQFLTTSPVASDLRMVSGTYTGTPMLVSTISGANINIDITSFTAFSAGALSFNIKLNQGKASGTVTGTVKSYMDSAATYLIDSGTLSFTWDGATARQYVSNTNRFVLGYKQTIKNNNGPLSFGLQQTATTPGTLVVGTHSIVVTSVTTTTLFNGFYLLKCKFVNRATGATYLASDCYLGTLNQFIIIPPFTAGLIVATSEWQIIINTYGANKNGILFPSANTLDQILRVDIANGAGASPTETNILRYKIIDSLPTSGGATSYVSNINEENLLRFTFVVSKTITTTGKFYLEFPTVDVTTTFGNTALYSSFVMNTNVPCVVKVAGATDSGIKCLFVPGSNHEYKPAQVVIQKWTSGVSAGQTLDIALSVYNGPTAGYWTQARAVSIDASYNTLNLYWVPYMTYHISTTITTTAVAFPSSWTVLTVQSSSTMGISINPPVAQTLSTTTHKFRFKYNSFLGNAMTAAPHTVEYWSTACMFIGYGGATVSTPQTLSLPLAVTPVSLNTFTSTFEMSVIKSKMITDKLQYTVAPFPTWTAGTITNVALSALGYNGGETTFYTISFTSNKYIPLGGGITIAFPTGYTIPAQTCTSNVGGTCANSGTSIQISSTNYISAGTTMTFTVRATNPAASGVTAQFGVTTYEVSPTTGIIATNAAFGTVTIGSLKSFSVLYAEERRNDTIRLQHRMYGPLTLNLTAASTLAAGTGYVTITYSPTATYWLPADQATTVGINLNCFWGNLAAACAGYYVSGTFSGYTVYAPYETAINSGSNWLLTITVNRHPFLGLTVPPVGTWTVVATYSAGGSQSYPMVIPNAGYWNSWLGNYMTTTTEKTLLYFRLNNHYPVNASASANKGQIIIEFPCLDFSNNAVFPIDLGTGKSNGDPVDCYASTGTWSCKINLGAPTTTSPATIIMETSTGVGAASTVDFKIPLITNPTLSGLRTQIRIYARYFTPPSTWTIVEERLLDYSFITTTSPGITTYTGLTATIGVNVVGQTTTATFPFNLLQTLYSGTYDRIIVSTTTAGAYVPPTDPTAPTQGTPYTYTISNWVELRPTVTLTAAAGFSAQFTNWINIPYVLATGVTWNVWVWKDLNIIEKATYNPTAPPTTHALVTKSLVTGNNKIRAVTTLTIKFTPYNYIPTGGTIVITVPSIYLTIGPQCDILGLLGSVYCVIQDDGDLGTTDTKTVTLAGFTTWTPAQGQIQLVLGCNNPNVGGTTPQFEWVSYWPTGEKIDEDTSFGTLVMDASATFIEFSLASLLQKITKTCGGSRGPLYLKMKLKNSLTYPNQFLTIELPAGFTLPNAVTSEPLCYFKNAAAWNLKTHRCDFNGQIITMYAPEEINFVAGDDIEIAITSRDFTNTNQDGIVVPALPTSYYLHMYTSNNLEESYPIAKIPACPFNAFWAESVIHHAGYNTEINFKATTTVAIPASNAGGRFVFTFPTHNEVEATFATDLGVQGGFTVKGPGYIGCGGLLYSSATAWTPLTPVSGTNVECIIMNATGQTWGDAAYVMTTDLTGIAINAQFSFKIARVMNPPNSGWPYWSHIRIQTQQLQADGSYADLNDHWMWYLVNTYTGAPGVSATAATYDWRFNWTTVNFNTEAWLWDKMQAADAYMVPGTYMIFEYLPNDYVLRNNILCRQRYNNVLMPQGECNSMTDSMWLDFRVTDPLAPPWTVYFWGFQQPWYTVPGGVQTTEYRVVNNAIVAILTHAPYNIGSNNMELVMQTPSATNDVSATLKYQIGVRVWTNINKIQYFRLIMPSDFVNPNSCVVRSGLNLVSVNNPLNQIQCVISASGANWLFEIYNFNFITNPLYGPYSPADWFIFDVIVTNPATAKFTGTWNIRSIDNYAGGSTILNRVIDANGNSDGTTWIGVKPFPQLFRVYINQQSFETRRASQSQWAEMHVRMITKKAIPPNSGQIQVWLPDTYNIPNGGTVFCTLGNVYHTDLTGQACTITSDRKVYVNSDPVYGIPANTCEKLEVTTTNSVGGNNGFQMPPTPGSDQFQIFMYNGSTLQEYNQPTPAVQPNPMTSFSARVIIRETNQFTVIRYKFTIPIAVAAGYDTDTTQLDPFLKAPIGTLQLKLNTRDTYGGYNGWPLNLGLTYTNIACKVITGLVPAPGKSSVTCKMIASSQNNPKNPVIVEVSDFQYLIELTAIEIHIMGVRNGGSNNNNGRLETGAYETYGDGSTAATIEDTYSYQTLSNAGSPTPQVVTGLVLTPNLVGSPLVMNLPFTITVNMVATDVYILRMPLSSTLLPAKWVIPDDGTVSAVIDNIQLTVYVYADPRINEIHMEMPTGKTSLAGTKTLIISGIRNMAYADPSTYTITLVCVKTAIRNEIVQYTGVPGATVAPFNSLVQTLSSYFSSDVYVTYSYTIVPSYDIPASSTFTISLPSPLYDHFKNSQPSATCQVGDYLENCAFSTSVGVYDRVTFTASSAIPAATALTVTLIGIKNPTFVGTIPTNSYNLDVTHPSGYLINSGTFGAVTFVSPRTPDKIFMIIGVTSYYKSVVADYSFQLQCSNTLPAGGYVKLTFPTNWLSVVSSLTTISDLVGSWTNSKLQYTVSYTPGTGILLINTQFDWPSKTTLTVKINSLTNPTISQTGVFVAADQYDGVTLDQTDPNDPSNTISYLNYAPSITVSTSNFYPQNAGENSIFTMTMTSATAIPSGANLEFDFPAAYGDVLTTTDKSIQCSSPSFPSMTCSVQNGKLVIPVTQNITSGIPFSLTISGLANPNVGAGGGISITTTLDGQTIQYTNNALMFTSKPPATNMRLTYLNTTSTNLEEKATYDICGETDGAIPADAQFFIDFPSQFNVRAPSYTCAVGAQSSNTLTYPSGASCTVINNMRRFIITGQTNSYAGGAKKKYCFQVQNVQNPSDSGQTDSFVFSVYDSTNKVVLYKTYGTLSFPTTLSYSRVGLRIVVSNVPDFAVGVMSASIAVSLEQKVPYQIQLTPVCTGFSFQPSILTFAAGSQTAYFNILPNDATKAGSYFIQWSKFEDTTTNKFAQVSDTYFNYVATAVFNQYQVLLSTTVSRTALKGTSLPITITLTQAASRPLTLSFDTIKPNQPDYVVFSPSTITFQPGETVKNLTYTTKVGAVSGIIQFGIPTSFENVYTMPQKQVNFEILDIDNTPPSIINQYVVELDRTYLYYRISTSESVWVYYLLTLKGTVKPPKEEIKESGLRVTRGTKTDVMERVGRNSSHQTSITSSYIYYDTYLRFDDLEEQTEHILYFFIEDLSGNSLATQQVNFTTLKKHRPCKFNAQFTDNTNVNTIFSAFSLVTGIPLARWQPINIPVKFFIPGNNDAVVKGLLKTDTVTYDFELLQNMTHNEKRPIETVALLQTNKYLLSTQLSTLSTSYDITKYSYEVIEFDQEFTFEPLLHDVNEDTATFNVSVKRNGTMFGMVLTRDEPAPSARQIRDGLNSTNFKVPIKSYSAIQQIYPEKIPPGVQFDKIFKFESLLDNTEYTAYFVAQNTFPVNPDLMSDYEIVKINFLTQRELFAIPVDYSSAWNLKVPKLVLLLILALMFIL